MRKAIIISLLALFAKYTSAQIETYYMNDWLGSSQWNYNPALQSKEKVYVYLPGLSGFGIAGGHTGFSHDDAIVNNTLNVSSLIDGMDDENHLLANFNSTLFAVGVKTGNIQLRTGVTANNETRLTYTKDLFELGWKGNGHPDVIGRRLSMDGTGVNSVAYLSYFVGGSVSLLDNKFNVGVNANFYNGIGTAFTENSTFGLRTNETNYALTLDGSYDLKTSGGELLEDDIDPQVFQPLSVKGNKGFGVDLGITYAPSEKFTIEASALNLGQINWTENIENFKLTEQEITYQGFELNEFVSEPDSTQSDIEQFVDSIGDLFVPIEDVDEFSSSMNNEFFVRGIFNISEDIRVSAFASSKNSFGTSFNSAGALFSKDFGRTLMLRGGLQLFNMKDALIPLGLVVNAGPVQLGLHTGNILAVFNPDNTKHFSGRFSLGFRFGKEKE